jgi:hypothetical protein
MQVVDLITANNRVLYHVSTLVNMGMSKEAAVRVLSPYYEQFQWIAQIIMFNPSIYLCYYCDTNTTWLYQLKLKEREIEAAVALRMLSRNYYTSDAHKVIIID